MRIILLLLITIFNSFSNAEMLGANHKKACDKGDAEACYMFGKANLLGADGIVKLNPNMGMKYLKKSCDLNSASGCGILAEVYENGYSEREIVPLEAMRLYKKACDLGDKYSCNKYPNLDKKLGVSELQKQCDKGNAKQCNKLGNMFFDKKTRHLNIDYLHKALKLYEKACNFGDINTCMTLGKLYGDKYGNGYFSGERKIILNPLKSTQFYIKSKKIFLKKCSDGDTESCVKLADLYRRGYGVRVNYEKVLKYNLKACNLGDSNACLSASEIYLDKTPDSPKGYALERKACTMGNAKGCLLSSYHCYKCPNKKRIGYLEKACYAGNSDVCRNIGERYVEGDAQVIKSIKTALKLYKKGCDLGNKEACSDYMILNETDEVSTQEVKSNNITPGKKVVNKGKVIRDNDLTVGSITKFGKIQALVLELSAPDHYTDKCKFGISLENNLYFFSKVNSKCLKFTNSKGIKIVCTPKKKLCKTRQEIENFVTNYTSKSNGSVYQEQTLNEEPHKNTNSSYNTSFSEMDEACNFGSMYACQKLGVKYADGEGVKQDYEKAKIYLDKACTGNDAEGCLGLGTLYFDGKGVKRNRYKGKMYIEKACNLGLNGACNILKALSMYGI